MRLVLIRHGETEHNRDRTTLGRADVPLNARGLRQANAIAASFVRVPDAIYTSPLIRARATADTIARRTGLRASVDGDLVEMDVGELEHLSGAELRERHSEFMKQWLSPAVADARMPGGEALGEVQERARRFVDRMRAAEAAKTVVAVTHNFVILTALCHALSLPLADFRKLRVGLASKSVIDITEHSCSVVSMNDVSHLIAAGLADDL